MTRAAAIELSPGTYTLPGGGLLQVMDDGSVLIRPAGTTPIITARTLRTVWLKDAPFTFDQFMAMMQSKNYIADGAWQYFQVRGNKSTSVFTVRACYEQLCARGCLPVMSMEDVKNLFNSIGANINNARRLDCNCIAESNLFYELFQLSDNWLDN